MVNEYYGTSTCRGDVMMFPASKGIFQFLIFQYLSRVLRHTFCTLVVVGLTSPFPQGAMRLVVTLGASILCGGGSDIIVLITKTRYTGLGIVT